jgi:carboxyl-terminal processing protease
VYGGGGIVPDLIVSLDTITVPERTLIQELGKFGQPYAAARLAYAVAYIRQNPSLQQNFTVTPQMLSEFYAALQSKGVKIDRAIYDAGSSWLADDIAYEITYSKWGEVGARARVNRSDAQVQVAAQLLQQATSPASLFKLAHDYASTHKQDEPKGTLH